MVLLNSRGTAPGEPWGPWATVGLGLLVGIGFLLAQTVVVVAFMFMEHVAQPGVRIDLIGEQVGTNGFVLSLSTCASTVVCVGLVLLFIKLRKGITTRRYLLLYRISFKTVLLLIGLSAIVMVAQEWLTTLYRKETLPQFMIDTYKTLQWPVLFWFAIVVAGPVFEEVFFRGFLLEGLRHSRIGVVGALLVTSLSWSVIHMQYPGWELLMIFFLGLIYGVVRLKTGSLWSVFLMHGLQNLVATIQTALYIQDLDSEATARVLDIKTCLLSYPGLF